MSYKVTAADLNNLRLNETDPVKSVLQNVAIIIATRKDPSRCIGNLDCPGHSWTGQSRRRSPCFSQKSKRP